MKTLHHEKAIGRIRVTAGYLCCILLSLISILTAPVNGNAQEKLADEGMVKWTYKEISNDISSPAITPDGTVYFGSVGFFYAVNPEGTLKWYYMTGYAVNSTPVIAPDGTIYYGCRPGNFYALNPDGKLKWQYDTGYYAILGSPAIGNDGTVYVGCYNGFLYAVNPDGTIKWKYKADRFASSPAIGHDGTIYIGCKDGYVYALTPYGTLKWKYKTPNFITRASPAIASDGTIYIGTHDNKFYAINPDGSLKWKYYIGDCGNTSPVIASDGTIYIGTHINPDPSLYALNPDGTLKWKYQTDKHIYASPAIGSDGTVYVGCKDQHLYAINPDGTLKWRYYTSNSITTSPVIAPDGTLYIGSDILYAFQTDSFGYQTDSPWPCFAHNNTRNVSIDPVALPELYTVFGYVTLPDSVSVADIEVSIEGLTTETDTNGYYSFQLPDGVYTINYAVNDTSFPRSINVIVDGENVEVTKDLAGQHIVRGRLTENGFPVAGITVSVLDKTTVTDEDGYYMFQLMDGSYTINFDIRSDLLPNNIAVVVDGSDVTLEDLCLNTIKWEYELDSYIYFLPTLGSNGIIYFVTKDGQLYAINSDGMIEGEYFIGIGSLTNSPSIADDGTLYVPCWNNMLALYPDCTFKWKFSTEEVGIQSSPAINSDGTIYFGSRNYFYAVNKDGTLKWKFEVGNHAASSPVINSDGTIYFSCYDNQVYALNPDGTLKWKYVSERPFYPSPVIGYDGTIYVGGYDDYLHAINPDGTLKWKYEVGLSQLVSPIIDSQGTLYFPNEDKYIYALNPDGTLKWKLETLNRIYKPLIIGSNNEIIAGTGDDKLISLNTNGYLNWEHQFEGRDNVSPIIAPDGTVYVIMNNDHVPRNGYLCAIQTGLSGYQKNAQWPCCQGNNQRTGLVNNDDLVWVKDFDGISKSDTIQNSFMVYPCFPNPFNTSTTISFTLPATDFTKLVIYNITGQKVRELMSETMTAGIHNIVWDGMDDSGNAVSSGVYISRLSNGKLVTNGRMVLMK